MGKHAPPACKDFTFASEDDNPLVDEAASKYDEFTNVEVATTDEAISGLESVPETLPVNADLSSVDPDPLGLNADPFSVIADPSAVIADPSADIADPLAKNSDASPGKADAPVVVAGGVPGVTFEFPAAVGASVWTIAGSGTLRSGSGRHGLMRISKPSRTAIKGLQRPCRGTIFGGCLQLGKI